ncbi:putative bifunctional diguanylate cyclase/phosphodiesterase [Microcella sp.]|uniref:putative bifunctional diguanylate cyclase/phosphodiesterase n=1 Tax=Microcella sp. TaxID=1913979 RepID=UPI0025677646|nr:GGDEF domain-containing phosphodiesterase [Microcella sp.]MBX9472895.1 EAL domain-containing protein [Microcella sp.]
MTPGGTEPRTWQGLLSLRGGQWMLIAGLLTAVGALLVSSVFSVAAHESELEGIFSQEGDGTAMTLVQRESFGVIVAIDSWARDDATVREVQIARAGLGQRLQVVTESGSTTFELTGPDYRDSLLDLDAVIRSLQNDALAERLVERRAIAATVDNFATQSRELSAVFQQITRDNSVAAIERRASVEQLQAIMAGVIVLMGVLLAVWLSVDLRQSYLQASQRLTAETRRLDSARRSLALRHELDGLARTWSDAIASGLPLSEILTTARADLGRLLPTVPLDVIEHARGGVRFVVADHAPVGVGDDPVDLEVDDDDVSAALERANESVALAEIRDLDQRRFEIERQHDPLTGLPTRELLPSSVTDATARARRRRETVVALALVDINRFADFNSSFGHAEGDQLLIEVAQRLQSHCGSSHRVLRLSADEFALVGSFVSESAARAAIDSISDAVSITTTVSGQSVAIAVTVGAVISSSGHDGAETLIQQAATALAAAQSDAPRRTVRYFTKEHDGHLMGVMREESALRSALHSGEFVMHYQPIVALETGAIAACEALVRWNRPGVGVVGPNDFLPAVARAGLTVDLGWQIIEQSLDAWGVQRAIARGRLDDTYLSINLDAAQLAIPTLADYILTAAERSGVPARCVVLEVTEHALLVGDVAIGQLETLRDQGVRIALDDFGTGYSSLSQASSLPLDILKIDRSFLPSPRLDQQQLSLIGDILSIATTLQLAVTAEGIETAAVAHDLRELGVDFGQGWHYARPMPIAEFASWLDEHDAVRITAT